MNNILSKSYLSLALAYLLTVPVSTNTAITVVDTLVTVLLTSSILRYDICIWMYL